MGIHFFIYKMALYYTIYQERTLYNTMHFKGKNIYIFQQLSRWLLGDLQIGQI